MEGLKGKVALVTGGATLIGAAVVRAFHREGTKVTIADIDDKNGQRIASALGEDVEFVKTDLADDAQITACVNQTVKKFGGVDFLINLACVYVDDALNATRKDWLDSYNINVVAGVMMLKAVKPHMVKRGGRRRGQLWQHQRQGSPDRTLALPRKQGGDFTTHAK